MQRFERPSSAIRDDDATVLDCREVATEEAVLHVRCDAVCEQERLRNSAVTPGKQLKRMASWRTESPSSSGQRQ
jgi:hypothetical protein